MQQVRKKTVWSDEALDKLLDDLLASGQNKRRAPLLLQCAAVAVKKQSCVDSKWMTSKMITSCAAERCIRPASPFKRKGVRSWQSTSTAILLRKKFKPYFDAWMAERQKLGIECEWLFPAGTTSEQMSDTTLNSWANTFSRMTGEDFYWHSLRHYFTTHLAKLGLPDNVIQDIVGWGVCRHGSCL